MNQTGAPGYDFTNTIPTGTNATKNVRLTATTAVPAGGTIVNALSMSGSNIALTFTGATDTLNLTSGGLIGPNNNQSIGATLDSGRITVGGLTPVGTQDLYLFNRANTLTVNARIIDNANGATPADRSVRLVVTASGGTVNLANGLNSYTGGAVVNAGTVTLTAASGTPVPAASVATDGLVLNAATATMSVSAQQIAAANIVTLNGPSALTFFGNNTIAGLVFNNLGGGATAPTVNTFNPTATAGAAANGVLTIGAAGITATSANVTSTSVIAGRLDFGATPGTITVDPIMVNGVEVAPLQAALAVQSVINSAGGIVKEGTGTLQFNAQQSFTGPVTVNSGGLRIGVTNAGSRYSRLTLNSGTRLDLNGLSTTLGSLEGSGTVFNSSATAGTLTVGFDNTPSTFTGTFRRFNDAAPAALAVTKVGSGTLSLTGVQDAASGSTGAVTVSGGAVALTGTGAWFTSTATPALAATFTVNQGGNLALDNAATPLNNRLGMALAGTVNVQGGAFTINGNSGANVTEQINTLAFANGGGTVTFTANPATQLDVTLNNLGGLNATGSNVFRGIDGSAPAPGKATLTIVNAPAVQGGQGGGLNGTSNMTIRGDQLADASLTGVGTGFLVKDSANNVYRAMGGFASGELNLAPATWVTAQNAGINGAAQTIALSTTANSLTVGGTSSLSGAANPAFGQFAPNGLLTQTLNTSSLLALDGSVLAVNLPSFNGTAGNTLTVHAVGNAVVNVNGFYGLGNTAGLLKAGAGTLSLNNLAFYTGGGGTVINGGTVVLNSGVDNTIAVVPGATTPATLALQLNGANSVLDLKNSNQAVAGITSVNPLPGNGGTLTNSGTSTATITSTGGGTFAGQLTGQLAFTRVGNNTTTLTNANTYTGPTIIRGGTLQLRDSGAILNTASVTVNYGTLINDNFGLNSIGTPNPTRLAATTPVTLQGGTLTLNGAGSTDNTLVVNSVTATGGNNTVNVLPQINEGSTARITIDNFVRNPANRSMVNFNGFTTNNSAGTSSTGGQGFSANGQIHLNQINGAAGPVSFVVAATTTAGSATVTVPSTTGLVPGMAVNGANIPVGATIATVTNATTFTLNSGTGVLAGTAVAANANSGLTNNLIGGWAVADGSTFATYLTGNGVSVMGQTTQGIVAPGFDGTDVSLATTATQNINDATAARTLTASRSANSWRLVPTAAQTITLGALGAPVTATLGVGVITNANFGITIRSFDAASALTGSGSDLYFYINQNTTALNTRVSGAINLIKSGGAALTLSPSTSYVAAQTAAGASVPITNTTGLTVGQAVIGTGIPNDTTITAIVDNTSVTLSNPTTAAITLFQAGGVNNTYTGGTFVQAGTLNLSGPAGSVAIPGDLTINNATVTMNVYGGQIAPTGTVNINGGGVLNLARTNTLNAVNFNNTGGAGNPTVATGAGLTLSAANAVNSVNDTLGTTPIISGLGLTFANAAPVITTSGLSPNDLLITAPITSANAISKAGPGSLALNPNFALANSVATAGNAQISVTSTAGLAVGMAVTGTGIPAGESIVSIDDATHVTLTTGTGVAAGTVTATFAGSTFTSGVQVNEGSLIFGQSTNQSGATVLAGPVGTGTLTLAPNATVLSDTTARTIGNAVAVTGDFNFGGVTAANNLILSGAMDLGAAGRTVTVASPAVNGTLSGALTSTATGTALTKAGLGTLTLSSAASNLGGAGIAVAGGILRNGIDNALPNSSPLAISVGAGYDLNGFDQALQRVSGAGFITNSANSAKTLVVGGINGADTTTNVNNAFAGVITDNAALQTSSRLGLTKAGIGSLTLTGANSYSGATAINSGTLELAGLSGGISGSTAVTVAANASLLISSTAADRINNTASFALNGGRLALANTVTGTAETIGALSVTADSIIDFGNGVGNGNTLKFSSLALTAGVPLKIYNWTGSLYDMGSTDPGTNLLQDRLLFSADAATGNDLTNVVFYSDNGVTVLASGAQVAYAGPGGGFEIVAVPEPSSVALLGGAALLGLAGYRRRRRA
ncbi:MAG: autotransporter-associated beta strand repeat-containing protein [Chthoniobacteraceae bacterium]